MNRLIISQVRRLTLAAQNQFRFHRKKDIPHLSLSDFPRHYSSAVDVQFTDKGIEE
jgi:hypothetical protein